MSIILKIKIIYETSTKVLHKAINKFKRLVVELFYINCCSISLTFLHTFSVLITFSMDRL